MIKHKVLMTFPPNSMIAKGMAYDCCRAFEILGHDYQILDLSPLGDNLEKINNTHFETILQEYKPTIFFTFHDFGLIPSVFYEQDIRLVSWFLDKPQDFVASGRESCRKCGFYYAFLFDKAYIPFMKDTGYINVTHLRLATNYERFSAVTINESDREKYDYDIAFVGNYTAKRGEVLKQLLDTHYKVGIWGNDKWKDLAKRNIHFNGSIDYAGETPKLYRTAKIILNVNDEQLKTTLNNRVYDVPAAGGFVLSDYREDSDLLFKKQEIAFFKDTKEMLQKIDSYLHNEEERLKLSKQAFATIKEKHTYVNRMEKVLKVIEETEKNKNTRLVALPYKILTPDYHLAVDKAVKLIEDGYLKKVKQFIEAIFKRRDEQSHIYLVTAGKLMEKQRHEDAAQLLNEALALNPKDPLILSALALVNIHLKKAAEADLYFNKAFSSNANALQILSNLAEWKILKQNYAEAKAINEQILAVFPNDIPALYREFTIAVAKKDKAKAVSYAERLKKLDKTFLPAIQNMLRP